MVGGNEAPVYSLSFYFAPESGDHSFAAAKKENKMSRMTINGVDAHYSGRTTHDGVIAAVRAAFPPGRQLTTGDLSPLDQFHLRGEEATRQLSELVSISADSYVLDVGSGIGGPARYIATKTGCRVTGIDLSTEYCSIARTLSEILNLYDLVDFKQGDATEMPFADESFDIAITQHVVMNIEDRGRLYSEINRVLRPHGRFAMYDVFKKGDEELTYPVPWARDASLSFLRQFDETRSLLTSAGFAVSSFEDITDQSASWLFQQSQRSPGEDRTPLGLELLMGSDFDAIRGNYARNLRAGRIGLLMAVVEKV